MRRGWRGLCLVATAALLAACSSSNNNGGKAQPSAPAAGASASATRAASAGSASATAAAASTSAAAPSASAAAAKVTRGGTLTIAIDSNMKNLDPLKSTLLVDRQIHYQLYDSLVTIGPDLKIQPDLADSWDTSDPKAIVFKLHQGVKFQDGTDFDASVASVDVIDQYTVKLNLTQPFAPLLATLVDRAGMMLSPTAIQKLGDGLTTAPAGAGTGPFRFVEWQQDDHVTLERNPSYWKKEGGEQLPYLDKLVYKIIPDENNRLNNLKTGDVDIAQRPPAKDIAAVKKDSAFVYKDAPALEFDGIELNVQSEPFNNKALRQAVAYAIDRETIVQTVFYGLGVVSNGPISPPLPPYDASFKPYTHDVAKAKVMLAAGGKPNGFSFDLLITSNSPAQQQQAELIKDELKDVGITVNIVPEEFTKLVDDTQTHHFTASILGWSGRIDPDGNSYNHFHTGGGFNDPQYSNQQVDALLDQARASYDPEQRNTLYKQINQMVTEDAPWIFIYHPVTIELHTPKVKGFVLVADGIQRYATVWKSQ